MNFNELFQKMRELDQPVIEEPNEGNAYGQAVQNTTPGEEIKIDGKGTGDIKREEVVTDECGMGPMGQMNAQQDNVNMSVNMNGAGAGGIRDLLDILKNLDGGSGEHGDAHDLGDLIDKMDGPDMPAPVSMKKPIVVGDDMPVDEFANEPDEMYAPVQAVTPTGNDIHSKGAEFPKVNGGGNPMAMESLVSRLDSLYQEVKSR
jgi:hypothetical protein